jgi:cobalt-zinc-cadmium efflux system membrane fusion protein
MKNVCFVSIVLLMLVSCGNNGTSEKSPGENALSANEVVVTRHQFEAAGMILSGLEKIEAAERVVVTGKVSVSPENHSLVSSFAGGRVKSVLVTRGSWVSKGDGLFELEDPAIVRLQQDYMEAFAQLPVAKADFERQKQLAEDEISSQKVLQEARARYLSAQARVSSVREQLLLLGINPQNCENAEFVSSIIVRAPVPGNITMMEVQNGMYLQPQIEVIEIVDPSEVYLDLNLFESDIRGIEEGMKVDFKSGGGKGILFRGEISHISKKVRDSSRSFYLQARLGKDVTDLYPGMFVNGYILKTAGEMFVLPEETVVTLDKRNFVLLKVAEDDETYRFKQIEVKSRPLDGGWAGILNYKDFAKDDEFLSKGAFGLINE